MINICIHCWQCADFVIMWLDWYLQLLFRVKCMTNFFLLTFFQHEMIHAYLFVTENDMVYIHNFLVKSVLFLKKLNCATFFCILKKCIIYLCVCYFTIKLFLFLKVSEKKSNKLPENVSLN